MSTEVPVVPTPPSPVREPKRLSEFVIVGRSFKVTFRHLPLLLGLAAVLAIPGSFIGDLGFAGFNRLAAGWLPAHGIVIDPQQAPIWGMSLAQIPVLFWTCIVGSFVAPAVIRVFLRDRAGQRVTAADALSFAMQRWSKVIWPYTLSAIIISVGYIVVVPGILYQMFFAFVEQVATLTPEVKGPLTRSRKLTWGRRGRIFRIFLLFIWWWGWYDTFGQLWLVEMPVWARLLASIADAMVGILMLMAMLQLYLERMDELQRRIAEKAEAGEEV